VCVIHEKFFVIIPLWPYTLSAKAATVEVAAIIIIIIIIIIIFQFNNFMHMTTWKANAAN